MRIRETLSSPFSLRKKKKRKKKEKKKWKINPYIFPRRSARWIFSRYFAEFQNRQIIERYFFCVTFLGSWPVTNPDFDESSWDAMKALVDVHKNISQAPVFNLYVSGDIKNSNENVIVVRRLVNWFQIYRFFEFILFYRC